MRKVSIGPGLYVRTGKEQPVKEVRGNSRAMELPKVKPGKTPVEVWDPVAKRWVWRMVDLPEVA